MRKHTLILILATVQAIAFSSCAVAPSVKQLTSPLAATPVLGALLNSKKLTPETHAYLKEQKLEAIYRKDPAEAVAVIQKRLTADPSHTDRLALIELCSDTGDRLFSQEPREAAGYHLAAAEAAYSGAIGSAGDVARSHEFVTAYNHSCGQVARILFDADHDWTKKDTLEGPGKTYRLKSRTSGPGYFDPEFINTLDSAEYLEFKDFKLERIRREGVGAAMVGHRKSTPERHEADPFLPPVGMALPLNATLEFSRGGGEVELAFHDLLQRENAQLAGRTVPLAADLTAPFAILYNYMTVKNVGMKGLRHPEKYIESIGLYQLEPYRPDQIPVVLVHGLMSSPQTWVSALNQLRADPVLRDKYQLYVFRYPTGFPIAYNAAALRRRLKEFQEHYDPNRSNPHMRNMVLVGHSMGGMLSNAQIRSSGNSIEKMLFDHPIDEINELEEVQKKAIKELIIYEANPDITRAIFVASPHRGSKIAQGPIGALGSKLIKFPLDVITVEPLPEIPGMTEAGRDMIKSRPDSISALKPDSPGPKAILEQPIRKGVTIHSIIGRHKPEEPLLESSDTVVPYTSAHLDVAVSEKVVEATHMTINSNPDAIEELRRILYLHAGAPYQPSPKRPAPTVAE